jgi:hypothetical protein
VYTEGYPKAAKALAVTAASCGEFRQKHYYLRHHRAANFGKSISFTCGDAAAAKFEFCFEICDF